MAVIRRTALIDIGPSAVLPYCLAQTTDASWNAEILGAVQLAVANGQPRDADHVSVLTQIDEQTVRCTSTTGPGSTSLTLSLAPIFGDATWLTGLLHLEIPDDAVDLAAALRERSLAVQQVISLIKDATDADLLRSKDADGGSRSSAAGEGSGAR